jgi:hypothetical protein
MPSGWSHATLSVIADCFCGCERAAAAIDEAERAVVEAILARSDASAAAAAATSARTA